MRALLSLVAIVKLTYCISLICFLLRNLNFFLLLCCEFCFKRLSTLSFLLLLNC